MATDAAWVWVPEQNPPDPKALARFAQDFGVREAYVSVPWQGPSDAVRGMARALRAKGIATSALGGDPGWALDPQRAVIWAKRAHVERLFSATHLDIEPWVLPDWPARADKLLAGVARAAAGVVGVSPGPVSVDLAPWLADSHREGFIAVARASSAVILMSYRDTAEAILAVSAQARTVLKSMRRPYRLAVDTLPSPDPRTTFAGQPAAALVRETTQASQQLAADSMFKGFAVHDLAHWAALPASP